MKRSQQLTNFLEFSPKGFEENVFYNLNDVNTVIGFFKILHEIKFKFQSLTNLSFHDKNSGNLGNKLLSLKTK